MVCLCWFLVVRISQCVTGGILRFGACLLGTYVLLVEGTTHVDHAFVKVRPQNQIKRIAVNKMKCLVNTSANCKNASYKTLLMPQMTCDRLRQEVT